MTGSSDSRLRARKAWLKKLAAERRSAWMIAVRPRSLDGSTELRTRNDRIHLEDGVVSVVISAESGKSIQSPLVGMRIVGWAGDGEQLLAEFVAGARAILWRREKDAHAALALTGRILELGPRAKEPNAAARSVGAPSAATPTSKRAKAATGSLSLTMLAARAAPSSRRPPSSSSGGRPRSSGIRRAPR